MIKNLRTQKLIDTKYLIRLTSLSQKSVSDDVKVQFAAVNSLPFEYNKIYEEINSSGFSILRTAHRLCEYAKVLSGCTPKVKTMDIGLLLLMLYEKSAPYFEKKEKLLLCSINKENLYARIDEESFYYSVLELLLNACEHSKPHSRIYVKLADTSKYVKIEVQDYGFGMNESIMSHCTEPFFTTEEKRTGLGLTLTDCFAKSLGGKLSVSSSEGKGTCVCLFLPKAAANSLTAEFSKPTILDSTDSPVEIMLY